MDELSFDEQMLIAKHRAMSRVTRFITIYLMGILNPMLRARVWRWLIAKNSVQPRPIIPPER